MLWSAYWLLLVVGITCVCYVFGRAARREHHPISSCAGLRLSRCSLLPSEIQLRILQFVVREASLPSRLQDTLSLADCLSLSKSYRHILTPTAYRCIRINSLQSLHQLRRTLVLLRPDLAPYVQSLRLCSLPNAGALGLEHLLLTLGSLKCFSLDSCSVQAFCQSTVDGLTSGAKPVHLSVVLPSTEIALCVSGMLMSFAICSQVEKLQIHATYTVASTFLHRLCSQQIPLQQLHVHLHEPQSSLPCLEQLSNCLWHHHKITVRMTRHSTGLEQDDNLPI